MLDARPGNPIRVLGVVAIFLTAAVIGLPSAAARVGAASAPADWVQSSFDAPLDENAPSVRRSTLRISGTFRYQKPTPASEITGAVVEVTDDPADNYRLREGCRLPARTAYAGNGTEPGVSVDTLTFRLPEATFNCNGRYLVKATATANDPEAQPYTMGRSVLINVLPESVPSVTSRIDVATGQTVIEWEPLPDESLAIDALGYVVQRAGPADENGEYGEYTDIAIKDLDDPTRKTDQLDDYGEYRYRVRSTRDSAEGPLLSSVLTAEVASVSYPAPPPTTTTTTTTRPLPKIGAAVPKPTQRPQTTYRPPATIDTGFEETLDYSNRPPTPTTIPNDFPELATEDPLAGQSIVRDEQDGVGYLIPAAGALVMVIWAGHLAYLNRLAKDL